MKAYKGFNQDMTCRDFQYEEGKTYEMDGYVECCEKGFHACEYPLDCFAYYAPSQSVYREVEQDGKLSRAGDDTKVASSKITVGAKLDIAGLVKASFEYIKERADKTKSNHSKAKRKINSATGDWSANSATGNRSANSATGNRSANSATGDWSANSATGDWSANSATGDGSANSATGDGSANSATGDRSANSATGDWSANSATGDWSANSATGNRSANSATGYGSANISTGIECKNEGMGQANISVGWGVDNKCKGCVGSYLVLSEWGEWDGEKHPLLGAQMIFIDGEKYKADTFYMLKDGKFVEVAE